MKYLIIVIVALYLFMSCNKNAPNAELQLAISLINQNKYSEAITKLDEIIKNYPTYAPAYLHKATYMATASKNHVEMMSNLNKAIDLNPKYKEAYYYRGMIKDIYYPIYSSGISDYNKAIELDSNYADAYLGRAGSNNILKHYSEALTDIEKSIQLNLKGANTFAQRGLSLMGLKKYKDAIDDLTIAIDMDSLDLTSYYLRCQGYMEINETMKSCADCEKAARLGNSDAKVFMNKNCR